jgi:2-keto-4-pentenoate hydratase
VTRPIAISDPPAQQSPDAVAAAFVNARLAARALESYPGPLPDSLTSAYRCQAHAIKLWPDEVAGWKVGSIRRDLAQSLGQNRLIGPIFARSVRRAAPGELVEFRTFAGGFAAAEPEYVLQIGRDADPAKPNWTVEEPPGQRGIPGRRDCGQPAFRHQRSGSGGGRFRLRQQRWADPGRSYR